MKKNFILLLGLAALVLIPNAKNDVTNFSESNNISEELENNTYLSDSVGAQNRFDAAIKYDFDAHSELGLENIEKVNAGGFESGFFGQTLNGVNNSTNGTVGHYDYCYCEDEINHPNQTAVGAPYISPFLGDQEYNEPCSYDRQISGDLFKDMNDTIVDEDYYRFVLYGDADVSISTIVLGSNVAFQILKLECSETSTNPATKNLEHLYTHEKYLYGYTGDSYFKKRVNSTLSSGVYFIKAFGRGYGNDHDSTFYLINLSVIYKNTYSRSIAVERYCYNAEGIAWISDFNPFGLNAIDVLDIAFADQQKAIKYKVYNNHVIGRGAMEEYISSVCTQNEKGVTIASLFVYGNMRKQVKDLFEPLYNYICSSKKIKDKEKNEILGEIETLTEIKKWVSLAALGAKVLGLDVFSTILEKTGEVLDRLIEGDKEKLSELKDDIIRLLEFEAPLQRVLGRLTTNSHNASDDVVRIDINYTITYNKKSKTMVVKPFIYTPEEDYSVDDYIAAFNPSGYSLGQMLRFESKDDIERVLQHKTEARYYVLTNTGGCEEITLEPSNPGDSLNVGEYRWYYFDAPENGFYNFYSKTILEDDDNLDLYGELFNEIVPGRSTKGRLMCDDNSGSNNDFSLIYEMSEGDRIYIRARGANWTTYGQRFNVFVKKYQIEGFFKDFKNNETFYSICDRIEDYDGEPMEYHFRFATSGNKIFQTFGPEEVYMELYDQDDNCVAFDDGSGWRGNSLINYNVEQYKFYTLLVYGWCDYGEVMTTITAIGGADKSSTSYNDFEQVNINESFNETYSTEANTARILKINVNLTGKYKINAKSKYNSPMNILISSPSGSGYYEKCINAYDFDSEMTFYKEQDYFIILGAGSNKNELINLVIEKVDGSTLIGGYYEKVCTAYINNPTCMYYKFWSSGCQTFSLYGTTDASLELYDSNGNLLGSGSYDKKTCSYPSFTCNVNKDQTYVIKVNNLGKDGFVTAKLVICPQYYANRIYGESTEVSYCFTDQSNGWDFIFEPAYTGYYYVDTFLGDSSDHCSMKISDMNTIELATYSEGYYGKIDMIKWFVRGRKYHAMVDGTPMQDRMEIKFSYIGGTY